MENLLHNDFIFANTIDLTNRNQNRKDEYIRINFDRALYAGNDFDRRLLAEEIYQ